MGFVDGLFEVYKLRELISKAKGEILSTELISSYNHRFGTSLFTSNITFSLTTIEGIIMEKRLKLVQQKEIEGSLLINEYT